MLLFDKSSFPYSLKNGSSWQVRIIAAIEFYFAQVQ
jgi:hypothetical protein